ncbi:MAG: hypothetical protein M3Y22_18435, partial [Pseudomonadota bacterium]|nr:hypothetical protein [Pseudomonadota bacterium]
PYSHVRGGGLFLTAFLRPPRKIRAILIVKYYGPLHGYGTGSTNYSGSRSSSCFTEPLLPARGGSHESNTTFISK